MKIAGDEDGVEQRPGDLGIDAVAVDAVEDLAEGGEAVFLGVEGEADLGALEASAMRVVVVALGRIAQGDSVAFRAIGFDVSADTDRS